jgi:hypothetical protein
MFANSCRFIFLGEAAALSNFLRGLFAVQANDIGRNKPRAICLHLTECPARGIFRRSARIF